MLNLNNSENNVQPIQIAPRKNENLHDDLSDWIYSFSRFADEIVELVEDKHGGLFRSREFYETYTEICLKPKLFKEPGQACHFERSRVKRSEVRNLRLSTLFAHRP